MTVLLVKLDPDIGRKRAANIMDTIESIPDVISVEELSDAKGAIGKVG